MKSEIDRLLKLVIEKEIILLERELKELRKDKPTGKRESKW